MENAVESLEIVFGVMIFILALSITMSMFSQTRQAFQTIVEMRDIDKSYVTDVDGNYINYVNSTGETRTVGIETIIPMMYRAYKENFKILFFNKDYSKFELYKNGDDDTINYIDLQKEKYTDTKAAIDHLEKELNVNGLYNKLKDKQFTEKLGEYYQDDENGITEDVAEINKTKKRVVVYIVN